MQADVLPLLLMVTLLDPLFVEACDVPNGPRTLPEENQQ